MKRPGSRGTFIKNGHALSTDALMGRFGDCLRKRVMGSSFKENVARPGPTDLQAQELEHRRLFHATEDMTRMPRTVTSGSAYTVNRTSTVI